MTELIAVGAPALEFDLEASDGRRYGLGAVLGDARALLVFYPGNNTPG